MDCTKNKNLSIKNDGTGTKCIFNGWSTIYNFNSSECYENFSGTKVSCNPQKEDCNNLKNLLKQQDKCFEFEKEKKGNISRFFKQEEKWKCQKYDTYSFNNKNNNLNKKVEENKIKEFINNYGIKTDKCIYININKEKKNKSRNRHCSNVRKYKEQNLKSEKTYFVELNKIYGNRKIVMEEIKKKRYQ